MKRTPQQQAAIDSKGNVIVFAGAGSGKTSVLTERVFVNIKNGVHLDELLILTFTDNAASEMKERIKASLSEDENTKSLVPLVDSANICTYDSYFLFLVKKYCSRLNLTSNISNMPSDVEAVKKRQILSEILDRKYASKDSNFIKFVLSFSQKNDRKLSSFILEVDKIVAKLPNKYEFIDNYEKKYLSDKAIENFSKNYIFSKISNLLNDISYQIKLFEDDTLVTKYNELFASLFYCKTLEDFININVNDLTKVPIKKKITEDDKARKNYIDEIYNELKNIKKLICNKEDLCFDLENNREFIPIVLEIVKEIETEIDNFKMSKECFTFSDIAEFALKLLEDNEDIRLEIKNKLKMIMIDEYQDTSIRQEKFINLIANDNVFVVGDVKQSIYGFRDANPKQFINKYNSYKKNDGGQAIDMNTNFRSRHQVLDGVNYIFSNIMSEEFGGANYKSQLIEAGNLTYNKNINPKQYYGFTRLNYFCKAKSEKDKTTNEINAIINDIKRRIANKEKVFDKDEGVLRNVEFKDFTILVSKATKFEEIEETFSSSSIPINAIFDENLASDESITVLINILKFIDEYNKEEANLTVLKHCFFSIARSFLFSYSDEKLYALSIDNLFTKDEKYLSLADFSSKNKGFSISDIYIKVFEEFNFIERFSLLIDATSKISFAKIFYDRTKIMDDLGFSLSDFIEYLEVLDDLEIKMESRKGIASKNAVTLTTIHKSKGLEYPIVFLPLRYSKPKNNSKISPFFVSEKNGFWLPSLFNKENKCIHRIFRDYYEMPNDVSELIRVLYVAVTRAKEEVVITKHHIYPDSLEKDNSLDALCEIVKTDNLKQLEFEEDFSKTKTIGDLLDIGINNYKFLQDLPLTLEAPMLETNELNIQAKKFKIIDFTPIFSKKEKVRASKEVDDTVDINVLKIGTHYHLLMEMVDFKNKNTYLIRNNKEKFLIDRVLKNELFDNISNSLNIYKEYEYYDSENNYSGIIDLLVEYPNYIDIIDYKLKNIDEVQYDIQLNKYRDYIKRTFKKKVNCYLLSLFTNEVRRVDEEK